MGAESLNAKRADLFPLGAGVTLAQLEAPHALLARLREHEPVSWVPALGAWLVTRRDLVVWAMRNAQTLTVEDPRFSTGRVLGSSMLTLDGTEHDRHRAPFAAPFRLGAVRGRFTRLVIQEVEGLLDALEPDGEAELRDAFAGPFAAAVILRALGLDSTSPAEGLGWYRGIVEAVTAVTAGARISATGHRAVSSLRAALRPALHREPGASLLAAAGADAAGLDDDQVVANAAILLFGGIETTEGSILNAVRHLLLHPGQLARVREDPARLPDAVEESLRLEPSAATIDRYATRDAELGRATIARGDAVMLSIAAANRDPATFPNADRFDLTRPNLRQHLTFAQGPHVCLGAHLARLEIRAAVGGLLQRLGRLRLTAPGADAPRGLIFRKPPALRVRWD